jgi:hypothetical protein
MTAVLPIGYVTLLEAAEMLLPAMYAGVPDLPIVTSLRQEGIDVKDGSAMDRAVVELWKAVDKDTLRSVAIGGRPRRVVRLDPKFTKAVPTLRSPRGRGFTLLRQSNPTYHELATWFGPSLHTATLAFRVTENPEAGAQIDASPTNCAKDRRPNEATRSHASHSNRSTNNQ